MQTVICDQSNGRFLFLTSVVVDNQVESVDQMVLPSVQGIHLAK